MIAIQICVNFSIKASLYITLKFVEGLKINLPKPFDWQPEHEWK